MRCHNCNKTSTSKEEQNRLLRAAIREKASRTLVSLLKWLLIVFLAPIIIQNVIILSKAKLDTFQGFGDNMGEVRVFAQNKTQVCQNMAREYENQPIPEEVLIMVENDQKVLNDKFDAVVSKYAAQFRVYFGIENAIAAKEFKNKILNAHKRCLTNKIDPHDFIVWETDLFNKLSKQLYTLLPIYLIRAILQ